VVDDNPDSDIEAGTRLGIKTAQILRGSMLRQFNALNP
jgi:ribonucleotide monophosphatase NagD (HAD superfamily)